MKNVLLTWNIVLTLAAGYLFYAYYTGKQKSKSRIQAEIAKTVGPSGPFRIAYFEMDSIESSYEMVKDVKAEINKKNEELGAEIAKLGQEMDNRQRYYEQKQHTMTEDDVRKAQEDLMRLSENLKTRRQNLENEYQDFVFRRNLTVRKEIEKFLATFNEHKKYTYIMSYEQGLFYYKDTAYNITGEIVSGLNQEYKKAKK